MKLKIPRRMKFPNSCMRVLVSILFHADRGRVPSMREISRELGWSGSTHWVNKCLNRLEKNGLIEREKDRARAISPMCRLEIYRRPHVCQG